MPPPASAHDGPDHVERENDTMIDKDTENGHPAARRALGRRAFLGRAAGLGAAAAAAGPFGGAFADARDGDGKLFLIALEEHFATPELRRRQTGTDERLFAGGGSRPELLDLGAGRIADMDEAGIGIQVLSAVTPGAQTLSEWKRAYERLESTGELRRSWFMEALAACHKEGSCNFTTIGGVFVKLGLAVRGGRGTYRKV